MAKVPWRFAWAAHGTKTASTCNLVLPTNHWLESWTISKPAATPSPCSSRLWRRFTRPCRAMRFSCAAWPRWARPVAKTYVDFPQATLARRSRAQGKSDPIARFWNTLPARRPLPPQGPSPLSAAGSTEKLAPGPPPALPGRHLSAGFELVLATDPASVRQRQRIAHEGSAESIRQLWEPSIVVHSDRRTLAGPWREPVRSPRKMTPEAVRVAARVQASPSSRQAESGSGLRRKRPSCRQVFQKRANGIGLSLGATSSCQRA